MSELIRSDGSLNLTDSNLLFYDLEVFKHNSLAVFMDSAGHEWHFWSPDFDGMAELIQDKILVGYNNYNYDDYILSYMIRFYSLYENGLLSEEELNKGIKRQNDIIIGGLQSEKLETQKSIVSIDCFQQIDVSMPSLKKIEGNMGKNIFESHIPFDIDRPLTEREKAETLLYCQSDVNNTIEVFKLRRKTYFETKNELLGMLQNPTAYKWNTTTIAGNLLLKRPLFKWNKLNLADMEEYGRQIVPATVWQQWDIARKGEDKAKSVKIFEHNCEYVFGLGGLHGVALHKKRI